MYASTFLEPNTVQEAVRKYTWCAGRCKVVWRGNTIGLLLLSYMYVSQTFLQGSGVGSQLYVHM